MLPWHATHAQVALWCLSPDRFSSRCRCRLLLEKVETLWRRVPVLSAFVGFLRALGGRYFAVCVSHKKNAEGVAAMASDGHLWCYQQRAPWRQNLLWSQELGLELVVL